VAIVKDEVMIVAERQGFEYRQITTAIDRASFTRRHAIFLGALLAALVFDYAKPFSLSFIISGMRVMWALSETEGSYLAAAGFSGTVLGSFFWGFSLIA
jgi:hypothetical protein